MERKFEEATIAQRNLDAQAIRCRLQAVQYLGRPEAPFLLRIARVFEDLAKEQSRQPESRMATARLIKNHQPRSA